MSGIRQAEMEQRVGDQQMTELVVDVWNRNGMIRQQHQPKRNREQKKQDHAPPGPSAERNKMLTKASAPDQQARQDQRDKREF